MEEFNFRFHHRIETLQRGLDRAQQLRNELRIPLIQDQSCDTDQVGGLLILLTRFHALGDRAVEEAQNAIAAALGGSPNTYRHRIEHHAVLRDELLPSYNGIGIVPVLFGSYAICLRIHPTQQFKYAVPVELRTWEWPWRKLLDANPGIKAAWHSDFPVFPEISPMAHLYGFVTRNQVDTDGSLCEAPDWLKAGAITVQEVLPIMTINAAYAIFRDDEVGSLEPGKLADLIILSENPLQVESEALKDIQVLMTMIGGEVEYCAVGALR